MTAGGEWCIRCHHYIVKDPTRPGKWMHYSDEDWAGGLCECTKYLVHSCFPQGFTSKAMADLAEGFRALARSSRYATLSYTSLAAALELEEEQS